MRTSRLDSETSLTFIYYYYYYYYDAGVICAIRQPDWAGALIIKLKKKKNLHLIWGKKSRKKNNFCM